MEKGRQGFTDALSLHYCYVVPEYNYITNCIHLFKNCLSSVPKSAYVVPEVSDIRAECNQIYYFFDYYSLVFIAFGLFDENCVKFDLLISFLRFLICFI